MWDLLRQLVWLNLIEINKNLDVLECQEKKGICLTVNGDSMKDVVALGDMVLMELC